MIPRDPFLQTESAVAMPTLKLLYSDRVPIDEKISVVIPTVGQILDNEESYYSMVSMLTAMPIDYMVLLDDMGLDFSVMTEYELFLHLFPYIQTLNKDDAKLIFGDLDLTKFLLAQSDSGSLAFVDVENDIVIDKRVHSKIASLLRMVHGIKKDVRKPANKDAKEYMLETARRRLRRRSRVKESSQIESLITAMVNSSEFKYNFESVRNLTIYQFNESVKQVIKRVDYDNRMYGVYTGTIKVKDMGKDDLNWLVH